MASEATGSYGRLNLDSRTGSYKFTPNNSAINALNSNASDIFHIRVSDGVLNSDTKLVFNIVGANDAPNFQFPGFISFFDTDVYDDFSSIKLNLIASDVENDVLSYGLKGITPASGMVTKVGTYVSDGKSVSENKFYVILNGLNDKPIVSNIAPVVYTNTNAVDVFANATGFISASDADSSAVLAYGISGQGVVVTNGIASLTGLYGTLSVEVATGQYTYSPNQNQLDIVSGDAVDNFTVTVSDGIASVNKPF